MSLYQQCINGLAHEILALIADAQKHQPGARGLFFFFLSLHLHPSGFPRSLENMENLKIPQKFHAWKNHGI